MTTIRKIRNPHVPEEIWLHILSCSRDPNFLWSVCRRVSRSFRSHVDTIFRDKYIKETYIVFNDSIQARCVRYFRVETTFDRFSEDKTRVFFKDTTEEESDEEEDEDEDDVFRRHRIRIENKHVPQKWKEAMRWYTGPPLGSNNPKELGRVDQPPYMIRVRRDLNDTEIPGLEIDYEKREVSFDWRAMYSMFFREEEYVENKIKKMAQQASVDALNLQAMVESGGMELIDAMQRLVVRVKTSEDDARRDARRKRLNDIYVAHGLSGYDSDIFSDEEKEILDQMAASRLTLDRMVMSDDGGEQEGDDEGSESDEWEDMGEDEE
ncbi:uncharacterized protein BDZ99DRAFT_566020 [Mytilinidion resinicola]|uniref:F-box domain-containing protein n=1 Tax=Mytilinidion resinicola TaxID=574789 RepID=A0A6A6Z606_9PEZI|nr:uncharacterized protein BDZ99DRAFT_566020 [Mytilinidion resinicola]KAF2816159.1 hypothetical protein BDZ99DRAFT_566020 [Mytilinidion resinicola]